MATRLLPVIMANPDAPAAIDNQYYRGAWSGSTSNDTPTEIFLGGAANQRLVIPADTALAFQILVVGRDTTDDTGFAMEIRGGIIRDGSDNTSIIGFAPLTFELGNDITGATVTVSADDTNEALIVTVTGHASHTVNWTADVIGYTVVS